MIQYNHLDIRSHPHCQLNSTIFMKGYNHNLRGGKIRDNPSVYGSSDFAIWESGFRAYRDYQIAANAAPKTEAVISAAKLKQARNKLNRKIRGDQSRQLQLRSGKSK